MQFYPEELALNNSKKSLYFCSEPNYIRDGVLCRGDNMAPYTKRTLAINHRILIETLNMIRCILNAMRVIYMILEPNARVSSDQGEMWW